VTRDRRLACASSWLPAGVGLVSCEEFVHDLGAGGDDGS
jgi:hypothetical protein